MTDSWHLSTRVAGVTFEGRQAVAARICIGDWLATVRDFENAYDANACSVWRCDERGRLVPGEQVGYLPREVAATVAPMLEGGYEVYAHVADVVGGRDELSIGLRITLRRRGTAANRKGS